MSKRKRKKVNGLGKQWSYIEMWWKVYEQGLKNFKFKNRRDATPKEARAIRLEVPNSRLCKNYEEK